MGRWEADWPRSAYFIGIGGIAMSSLAILLRTRGTRVLGSDAAVYPPSSEMLAAAGIEVFTPFDAENVAADAEVVVVGNAISPGNAELERVLEEQLPLASMSEVIERLIVPRRRVTVVAGTHGKTTTSSVLAHLHHALGRDPSFFIGGELGNFGIGARLGQGDDFVIEGDEYDTAFFDKGPKFLHYWPRYVVLNSVEFDHADIYRDLEHVELTFSWLVRMIPTTGRLIFDGDNEICRRLAAGARCPTTSFGCTSECDYRVTERTDMADGQTFKIEGSQSSDARVELALPGIHNAKNAVAAAIACAAAAAEGDRLDVEPALEHLATFRPPRRRLERVVSAAGITVFDDFAHHPSAVELTLRTLRSAVSAGGRLIACVEPRSNTMVRKFSQEPLTEALALADWALIGPVDRPERFEDHDRLDVAEMAADLQSRAQCAAEGPLAPSAIANRLVEELREGDVVVLMSNGGFGGLSSELRRRLGSGDVQSERGDA